MWFNDVPVLMAEIPRNVRHLGIEEAMDWFYKSGFFGDLPRRETIWHLAAEKDEEGYFKFKLDVSLRGSGSQEIGDMLDTAWLDLRNYCDYCTWLYKRGGFTEEHRGVIIEKTRKVEMIKKLATP